MNRRMMNNGLFTSASQHWATPIELYKELDKEFHFNDDPCPLYGEGGLNRKWGSSTFCNPPYGKGITKWIRKAYGEGLLGKTIVCLVPSRTDTKWWHDYCMRARETRFLRGRLKFGDSKNSAPFPSAIVIFKYDSFSEKPPLLSDAQIDAVGYKWIAEYKEELCEYLYAQREIDVKHYLG